MRKEQIVLKQDADTTRMWWFCRDINTVQQDLPHTLKCRCEGSGDVGKQSRLSNARRPHNGQNLTSSNRVVDLNQWDTRTQDAQISQD
jgi:hypothetical protein